MLNHAKALTAKKRLGNRGETIAVRLLRAKGYTILVRNFRSRRNEIDIIALDGAILVFIEVKTRRKLRLADQLPPLTRAQKRRITFAARSYLRNLDFPSIACRFDFIEITLSSSPIPYLRRITHCRDFWTLSRVRS